MKIALYKGTSLVSKLIRWQTRGQYSHAAILLHDGSVIEAWQEGGVKFNPDIGTVHTPGTVVDLYAFTPALSDAEQDCIHAFALSQVGKKYDFRSVLRFLTRRPQSPADTEKWFCSELVVAACNAAGVELFRRTEPWEVCPDDLKRSLRLRMVGSVTT